MELEDYREAQLEVAGQVNAYVDSVRNSTNQLKRLVLNNGVAVDGIVTGLQSQLATAQEALKTALANEAAADARADDFFTAMQTARSETADRDERIRILAADLRIAQDAFQGSEEDALRAQERADELQARLREYEGGEMKIGPGYEAVVGRLQNVVDTGESVGLPVTTGLVADIKNALGAIRQLDGICSHRYRRMEYLQDKLDAEKVKTENASRRANTAERLMREARQELKLANTSIRKDSLSDAIEQITDTAYRVGVMLLGAGSGIKAGAEVRREMAVKYTLEHDAEHGAGAFRQAALALMNGAGSLWPFDIQTYIRLHTKGNEQERLAHAIALIAVAYDITRKEQDDA